MTKVILWPFYSFLVNFYVMTLVVLRYDVRLFHGTEKKRVHVILSSMHNTIYTNCENIYHALHVFMSTVFLYRLFVRHAFGGM